MSSDAVRSLAAAPLEAWIYRLAQQVFAPRAQRRLGDEVARVLGDWRPGSANSSIAASSRIAASASGARPSSSAKAGVAKSDVVSLGPAIPGLAVLDVGCADDSLLRGVGVGVGVEAIGLDRALTEMRRVLAADGRVLLIDAVLPRAAWRRPLAALIRAADRGRFMRTELALSGLLQSAIPAAGRRMRRRTYTATGLEGLVCCSEPGAACL